jgi:hypothetical protein
LQVYTSDVQVLVKVLVKGSLNVRHVKPPPTKPIMGRNLCAASAQGSCPARVIQPGLASSLAPGLASSLAPGLAFTLPSIRNSLYYHFLYCHPLFCHLPYYHPLYYHPCAFRCAAIHFEVCCHSMFYHFQYCHPHA